MKITFVRHGQTDYNVNKISQGQLDIPLNELGIQQAEKVALRLKNHHFDLVFSSDLSRASRTAEEIVKHHPNISLKLDTRLREIKCGIFANKPSGSVNKLAEESGLPRHKFRPEKGESFEDVQKRAVSFFNDLNKHTGKNILVVAHGAVLSTLFLHLLNQSFDKFKDYVGGNTAVSIIDYTNGPKAEFINCTKHLETKHLD